MVRIWCAGFLYGMTSIVPVLLHAVLVQKIRRGDILLQPLLLGLKYVAEGTDRGVLQFAVSYNQVSVIHNRIILLPFEFLSGCLDHI
jgi:hypothetical protein